MSFYFCTLWNLTFSPSLILHLKQAEFTLQMGATNPIKRVLPGRFYGRTWKSVELYFFLIPEEYPRLYLHLLVYCGVYFEGKTSLLLVKYSGNDFYYCYPITGDSNYCSDTDVKMNVGNTNEIKNYWLVLLSTE